MNRKVESEKDWGKENVRGHEKRDFFFKKIKKKKAVFRHLIGNDCSYGNEQQPNDTKPIFCCERARSRRRGGEAAGAGVDSAAVHRGHTPDFSLVPVNATK